MSVIGMYIGLMAMPLDASASGGAIGLERMRFPAGSTHELLAERVWLHGVPAQVLVFDVPQRPAAVARALSGQQPALADLHVLPGQLILSGLVGDEHWIARMEAAGAERTVGSISTMSVRAAPSVPRPAWLPDGARLRLDVSVMEHGAKMSERIWQHALPPDKMARLIEANLRQDGWTRLGTGGVDQARGAHAGVEQWWGRERERMKLWLVPLDAGTGLRVNGWAP
ncbi:hypothetical protein ABE485_13790 [Achromobacter spanius]|uniref:hypothetical protein n=1 Tax=Achromobacter spanius TaxID=217203 RepID=UPI0032088F65